MAITTHLRAGSGRDELRVAPSAVLSDEALAARVRRGDERAFEALYHRYQDPLHRYCASILRQPEDAEEALQSVMVSAFRSLAGAETRDLKVRPWLYRIAHNQCISMLRRRPAHGVETLTGAEASPSPGPAERLQTGEQLARLREDLLALPADQRGALVMRELSGLSHEQIAGVLGESASSVKQLIYQARAALHGMADGRRMECHDVRRRVSDGDGRVLRSRSIGAHLRACEQCRNFRDAAASRPGQLAALAPALPLGVGDRILDAVLGVSGGLGGGGGGGIAGAGVAATGSLPALGGGIGAKVAAVAAAAALGGSIVAVPIATTDAPRERPRDGLAAATKSGLPAPGTIPANVPAGPGATHPPATPVGIVIEPAEEGPPGHVTPTPAAAHPGQVVAGGPPGTVPPVPSRTPGGPVGLGGPVGPLPAAPVRPSLPVPVNDGLPSSEVPDGLEAVGAPSDIVGLPGPAPTMPVPAPSVPIPGSGAAPQSAPALREVPAPPLLGVAPAP